MKTLFTSFVLLALTAIALQAHNPYGKGLYGKSCKTTESMLFSPAGSAPTGVSCIDNHNGTVDVHWTPPADLTNFTGYSVYRSEEENFTPAAYYRLAQNINDTSWFDETVEDFHTYYYIVSSNYGGGEEYFSECSAGVLVNNTSQTTVLGYAYLEGENNHAGIKVSFVPESPSAVADSIYTNALGYFETHDLIAGVYSVWLSKPGYQSTVILEGATVIDDLDLGETTINRVGTIVSGNVSGTWSNYVTVTGDITVEAGDSLIIEAGTKIRFLGYYRFYIHGYVAAGGTEADTILMTSAPENQVQQAGQWFGIAFFDDTDDHSFFNYTKLEYAFDGVYAEYSAPVFTHCFFRDCSSHAAIIRHYANPEFYYCTMDNTNYGFYLNDHCDVLIDGCTITHQSNDGFLIESNWNYGKIRNSKMIQNSRYGIFLNNDSSPEITGNLFEQNNYGIRFKHNCDAIVTGNRFINNSYGIVFESDNNSDVVISRNIFAYNTNDGIYKNANDQNLTITYNTICCNGGDGIEIGNNGTESVTNNIIYNNGQYGLRSNAYIETFENNDIYNNGAGEISNTANLPLETWNFVSVNPNTGASCDIYRNISEDPLFVFSDSLDFNLTYGSKCTNGGAVDITDPDGTISDIGAVPFDHGNPHRIFVTGTGNQTVSLMWHDVDNDSLVAYKVYYKVAGGKDDYTFFASTPDTAIDVTGLTDNTFYDFTVTGSYAVYESGYAPPVSEAPGIPQLAYDPGSYVVTIPQSEDSAVENLTLTNNGTRDLSVSFPFANSHAAYAVFDGSGDYVTYGNPPQLQGMDALTLECWIYMEGNNTCSFVSRNHRYYELSYDSYWHRLRFVKGYANSGNISTQNWLTNLHINTNQWYHIAVAWEGNVVKLYADGEQIWETDDAVAAEIPPYRWYTFDLGRRGGENGYYLNGRIAEVRLWNIARTGEEIKQNMFMSLSGNEEGLVGYWPLQEDYNDHSVYGATPTVYGETHFGQGTHPAFVYYTVPQSNYLINPGQSEVVPLTFYNRDDMTSVFFTTSFSSNDNSLPRADIDVFLQYGTPIPTTPVYFDPVDPTGKPYTIVIKDAEIDGETIVTGDEIGVFDGNLCVGAGIFDGTFNFAITAWESDPGQGLAGFTAGHNMVFRIYDASVDLETNIAEETYFIGDDTFGYGTFSALSLEASVFNFQNISVTGGQYNLISFNLLPRYPDAWDVFGGLENLQIVYNDDGGMLIPQYNINTIGDINFLDGFYLFTDTGVTLSYEGTRVHVEDWGITLAPSKWNYISVLSQNPVAVEDVFSGLENTIDIVQSASGESWIPSLGINTLGDMQPGRGYKVALDVDTAVTFYYPAGSKNTASQPSPGRPEATAPVDNTFFESVETGLPWAVVLTVKSPQETPGYLLPGDEIGLFDGNLCVGAAVYQGGEQLLITAWEKDDMQNLPGFTPGNTLSARVHKPAAAQSVMLRVADYSGNRPLFGQSNYGNFVLETLPIVEDPFKFGIIPNPFKETTTVIFDLHEDDLVKVNVFDGSGRLVKLLTDQRYAADEHRLTWDGTDMYGKKLCPGVYFVTAETTHGVYIRKAVILK